MLNTTKTTFPRTSYSKTELKEFEMLIVSKMDQAKKLIHFYQNIDKNENAGCSAVRSKNLEDASEIASRQQNDKIWAAQEKFLFELTSALARIRTSTYGICQKTGELIDKKRLMLVPHTTTCVQAKNQQLH